MCREIFCTTKIRWIIIKSSTYSKFVYGRLFIFWQILKFSTKIFVSKGQFCNLYPKNDLNSGLQCNVYLIFINIEADIHGLLMFNIRCRVTNDTTPTTSVFIKYYFKRENSLITNKLNKMLNLLIILFEFSCEVFCNVGFDTVLIKQFVCESDGVFLHFFCQFRLPDGRFQIFVVRFCYRW